MMISSRTGTLKYATRRIHQSNQNTGNFQETTYRVDARGALLESGGEGDGRDDGGEVPLVGIGAVVRCVGPERRESGAVRENPGIVVVPVCTVCVRHDGNLGEHYI